MKNEMKLIMENWRRNTSEFDPIYVENILGIKVPLVEGKYRISESLREDILIQENFIKNFFKGVKDGFFQKLGALKNVFKTLYQVITDPSKIKTYVFSLMRTKIRPYKQALIKIKQKLSNLNMPTFASAVDRILKDIEKIAAEAQPIRKAISFTTIVLLLEWVSGSIKDQVDEMKEGLIALPASIEKLGEQSLNIVKKIIMKKLPKMMVKLFTAIGASIAAFPAWTLLVVKLVKGAIWVGESLKDTLSSFKMRTDREANVKKAKDAGIQAIGSGGEVNIAERNL